MEHQIELEALKLLVQVAWADHYIDSEEAEYILGLASQMEVRDEEYRSLQEALADEGRLPAPNLDLLRDHRVDVLQSIDQVIAIDRHIVDDERAVRDAVAHMLSAP